MILALSTREANTAFLPMATHQTVSDAAELAERVAATCSDDLLTTPPDVIHDLDRLAVAALSALIAVDRDLCRLSMADTAVVKRLIQRIGGLS